jgi:hypothetical protein
MKEHENNLDRAIDALKNESVPPGPPPQVVDATIEALARAGAQNQPRTNKTRTISSITKIAAAALLLITTGYAVGRLSAARPDIDELQATLEPAIRDSLLEDVNRQWQLALADSLNELRDQLSQQFQRDLSEFALRTLAASGVLTNQRLQELVHAIDQANTQQRRWVTSALSQIELNRLRDRTQLTSGLEALALQTDDELKRTKQDMVQLLFYTPPGQLTPELPYNTDLPNERREK